jgi:hypothetical protein
MTLARLHSLKTSVAQHSSLIIDMLEDYSLFVNDAQARFISAYVKSLELDFELAMTRGQDSDLVLIVEDLKELRQDTALRLEETLAKTHQA